MSNTSGIFLTRQPVIAFEDFNFGRRLAVFILHEKKTGYDSIDINGFFL